MTQPIQIPGPGSDAVRPAVVLGLSRRAILSALAVVLGTALLGALAGLLWAVLAPRAALVMIGPGEAALVHSETSAYVAADGLFVAVALTGGALSGLLGYLFAVRRHGPVAMAGVLAGAVAAAFLARWVGEQSGRAQFHHLLATLPVGARLNDLLALSASSALAFWPLAAGLVAGGLEMIAQRGAHRAG